MQLLYVNMYQKVNLDETSDKTSELRFEVRVNFNEHEINSILYARGETLDNVVDYMGEKIKEILRKGNDDFKKSRIKFPMFY